MNQSVNKGDMECQYIERSERKLFSVYHPPAGNEDKNAGILLCNPLGQEQIRCHRIMVNLARKLSAAGWHVMRFDYQGTGDSEGDFESLRLRGCEEDIVAVAREFQENCGLPAISILGIRMGATLAYRLSEWYSFDNMVLWSPVWSGKAYMDEIVEQYNIWLEGSFAKEKVYAANGVINVSGFSYSAGLVKEITSIQRQAFVAKVRRMLVIGNPNPFEKHAAAQVYTEENKDFWLKKENDVEKSIVPAMETNLIIEWLGNTLK